MFISITMYTLYPSGALFIILRYFRGLIHLGCLVDKHLCLTHLVCLVQQINICVYDDGLCVGVESVSILTLPRLLASKHCWPTAPDRQTLCVCVWTSHVWRKTTVSPSVLLYFTFMFTCPWRLSLGNNITVILCHCLSVPDQLIHHTSLTATVHYYNL